MAFTGSRSHGTARGRSGLGKRHQRTLVRFRSCPIRSPTTTKGRCEWLLTCEVLAGQPKIGEGYCTLDTW